MTSADGAGELNVDPGTIRTHATNLSSAGSGLTQALEAAQAVSAPSDAFGQLCAFLGPLFVDAVETDGIEAIQAAITAFGDTSANLTAVADAFTTRDTTHAAALKNLDV
ncbi:type VII secretion target [Nocardia caishijiensis]|uniref:Excreted virulence factor EspC (Type VII ESX diderm) n=1 Tax=Nocardia caishijiensis TaxID=184756 RepID=A0ABQ6YQ28_9NOCA|nr:type VII secretion target [Nocardia caishijiensis]KAF0847586.1 excreted virulence factor EspC (type VII ESX diderm) [Nocardia caishijiensis]